MKRNTFVLVAGVVIVAVIVIGYLVYREQNRSGIEVQARRRRHLRRNALTKEPGSHPGSSLFLSSSRRFGVRFVLRQEEQAVGAGGDLHQIAVADLAGENFLRQRILHLLLDDALQRPRAVGRVVALLGQPFARRSRRARARSCDRSRSFFSRSSWMSTIASICSRFSRWKRITSSTRFRNSGRKFARTTAITCSRTASTSSVSFRLTRILGAEIGGHDDQRVAEIDRAALPVGQAAVVEHLQQHVEDVRVRLLDLVEEDRPDRAAGGPPRSAPRPPRSRHSRAARRSAARRSASPCIPTCRGGPSRSRRRRGTRRAPWSARSCRRRSGPGT